jgi:protein phosphatase PTC7
VLLGQLDSATSQLSLVNLGDSAAMILRPTPRRFARVGTILWPRLVARTQEQTHYFNCPYQVGSDDMSHTVREGSPDEIQVAPAALARHP